jgi:hypothetical protein
MPGTIVSRITATRFIIEHGCLGFGSLFFLLYVGIRALIYGEVAFDSASYLLDAGLSILAGGVWGVLVWNFVIPRTRFYESGGRASSQ